MNSTDLLIVEDDSRVQRLMENQLTLRGFRVRSVTTGLEALREIELKEPDLVLLDITLPDINGLDVCRRVRRQYRVPIILVTAADRPQTKVIALESGGDDYLTKPFHMGELIARIRAVLRRTSAGAPSGTDRIEYDGIAVDLGKREVTRDNTALHLTKIEFELLKLLITHPDKALPYSFILNAVWGSDAQDVRPVHVHICNLRRKLEPGPTSPRRIIAVPGIGYRFRGIDIEREREIERERKK